MGGSVIVQLRRNGVEKRSLDFNVESSVNCDGYGGGYNVRAARPITGRALSRGSISPYCRPALAQNKPPDGGNVLAAATASVLLLLGVFALL